VSTERTTPRSTKNIIHCILFHNFHINDNWRHCNTAWLQQECYFYFSSYWKTEKSWKLSRLFLLRPRTRPIRFCQDQDQDFSICPRGTSRPRLWSYQDFGLEDYITVSNVQMHVTWLEKCKHKQVWSLSAAGSRLVLLSTIRNPDTQVCDQVRDWMPQRKLALSWKIVAEYWHKVCLRFNAMTIYLCVSLLCCIVSAFTDQQSSS